MAASVRAGAIGVAVVLLFMLIYYRLPGFLADVALVLYALANLAIFMAIPITLTLPAITGFLLSTGMAVDANILVFERMKEELRRGGSLRGAILTGFDRAWTSIRDSNIATLVICLVLCGRLAAALAPTRYRFFALTLTIGGDGEYVYGHVPSPEPSFVWILGQLTNRINRSGWLLGV